MNNNEPEVLTKCCNAPIVFVLLDDPHMECSECGKHSPEVKRHHE